MPKRKLKKMNKIIQDVQQRSHIKKRKPKRHIRKSLIVGIVVALVIGLLIWKVPTIIRESKLKDLGYSKETIKQIEIEDLTSTILNHEYYSKYLEDSILDGSFQKEYISLYASITSDRSLTNEDLLLYSRLLDIGYESDQLENLFNQLYFHEITPLLVFDYQWDENPYIEDCLDNRESNSENSFSLSSSYHTLYKLQSDITDPSNMNVLVNSTFSLSNDYVPTDLTTLDTQYAVSDVQLRQEVADSFIQFVQDGISNGHYFYATTGYRSYEIQEAAYNSVLASSSASQADKTSFRAGHSEHQTGLAVNVTATYETNVSFQDSQTFQWMKENCTTYGFILRYPTQKSSITGNSDEEDHFRYVGKELAQKVTDSNLTYDEYYLLYLSPWEDSSNIPSTNLLETIDNYHVD